MAADWTTTQLIKSHHGRGEITSVSRQHPRPNTEAYFRRATNQWAVHFICLLYTGLEHGLCSWISEQGQTDQPSIKIVEVFA